MEAKTFVIFGDEIETRKESNKTILIKVWFLDCKTNKNKALSLFKKILTEEQIYKCCRLHQCYEEATGKIVWKIFSDAITNIEAVRYGNSIYKDFDLPVVTVSRHDVEFRNKTVITKNGLKLPNFRFQLEVI